MKLVLIVATAALAIAASVAPPASPPAQAAGERDAAPRCLQVRQIQHHIAISNREILFYMDNGAVWRNALRAECPGLKFENAFAWDVSGGDVCANQQTIYVLHQGNACQLGEFSPYTPSPRS